MIYLPAEGKKGTKETGLRTGVVFGGVRATRTRRGNDSWVGTVRLWGKPRDLAKARSYVLTQTRGAVVKLKSWASNR